MSNARKEPVQEGEPEEIEAEDVDGKAGKDGEKSAKKAKKKKAKKPNTPKKEPKAPKEKSDKKKSIPWVLVLVPVALIAAAVLLFTLPPTHAMLVKSPLGSLLARFNHAPAETAAATPQKSADPGDEVTRLNETLANDRKDAARKDAQIAQLASRLRSVGAQPRSAPPKSAPHPSPASTSVAVKSTALKSAPLNAAPVNPAAPDAASADAAPTTAPAPAPKPTPTVISDDVKRAATYWASMDADKAAGIVQQLPESYVRQVFSQMSPDTVADIMGELPAKTAARLSASATPAAPESGKPNP